MKTNDDSCDGGNTYGMILEADMKTEVAVIADSYIECSVSDKK